MLASRRVMLQTMMRNGIGMTVASPLAMIGGQLLGGAAQAQQARVSSLVDKINGNTLMLLTAGSGLTYGAFAYDLATVLNDGDNFRILPVSGHSAYENVRDIRYLRGIDMGFTQTNILGYWRRSGQIPDLADKIVFLFKVCNEEDHIVVHSDIKSMEELHGKKVNFNQDGSGTQLTARDLFSRFKIQVQEVNLKQGDGLEKLKNNEIAAIVATTGKPSPVLAALKASDGYRILPIPFNSSMLGDYVPSTLTHDDYPTLIPAGETVETVASGTVMLAYNWPKNTDRYRRLQQFVTTFFPRLADFQKPPRHEKWKETNLAATLPGWKRFEGAEDWLKNARDQELADKREQFQQFLASRNMAANGTKGIPDADRDQLFQDFVKWMSVGSAR
jgi:TRAP transporter TAXI family solute receptor